MNWAEFNWMYLGSTIWLVVWAIFLVVAIQRNWTAFSMLVGIAHMVVVMLNAVAPFRGALDPNYAGYSFLAIKAAPGLAVTAIAGPILLLSFAAALVAIGDRRGTAMWFLAIWSGLLAALFGVPLLIGLVTDPTSFSIQLGEYLTIPWYLSFPLLLGLVVLPFALAVPWAYKRVQSL